MNGLETSAQIDATSNYLSRERFAQMLDVSEKTIDRRVDERKLPEPDLYVGRQPRWEYANVVGWLKTHKQI